MFIQSAVTVNNKLVYFPLSTVDIQKLKVILFLTSVNLTEVNLYKCHESVQERAKAKLIKQYEGFTNR